MAAAPSSSRGVVAFDDFSSIGHVVLGAIAARWALGALVVCGFTAYQLFEVEPMENKRGDFLEFGIGYAAGRGWGG